MFARLSMGPVRLCKRCWSSLSASEVVQRLKARGLGEQNTKIEANPPPPGSAVYVGFDPTADSLHIGNLVAIMSLLHFRREGYQPIAVIGGATGLVGDPSGRSTERDRLQHEMLNKNLVGLSECLTRIFHNDEQAKDGSYSTSALKILNNAEWWDSVSALEFVSEIARHFRLGSMLARESVNQRLSTEEGMSCTEFLYPIFQAFDFLQLHKHHNCWIQLGGGDQWGNITAGCNFVKKNTDAIVHGITLQLLTTSSGAKLGKSANNALWLSPARTSPYEFYQYFLSTADDDVEKLLKFFTFLPLEEIQQIMTFHQQSPDKFGAQQCLAKHVTQLVHGNEGLQQALNATAALYSKDPHALMKLTEVELRELFSESLTIEQPLRRFTELPIVDLAVMSDDLLSKKDVVKLIKHGGLYVNSVRVESVEDKLGKREHLLPGNITVLRFGKKKYRLIKWT